MAKGQLRGNREAKKPKKEKRKDAAPPRWYHEPEQASCRTARRALNASPERSA